MLNYLEHGTLDQAAKVQHVAVCICTYLRPKMLARCLESLQNQSALSDVRVSFVVIDNDEHGSALAVVNEFVGRLPWPVHYRRENRRGIAPARNAALTAAKDIGADWIAFIDDDEIADPDWIARLMAPEYRQCHVLMGMQTLLPPEPRPFWCLEAKKKRVSENQVLRTAYTNNVRFSIALVDAGLRFNEQLGLSGGEDSEFFGEASRNGFEIRRTLRAVTYETVPSSRLTFWRQFLRAYTDAATNLRQTMARKGWAKAVFRALYTIPVNIVLGVLLLLVSPLCFVGGPELFKRAALAGNDKLARAAGRLVGLAGLRPQFYRTVDGE